MTSMDTIKASHMMRISFVNVFLLLAELNFEIMAKMKVWTTRQEL